MQVIPRLYDHCFDVMGMYMFWDRVTRLLQSTLLEHLDAVWCLLNVQRTFNRDAVGIPQYDYYIILPQRAWLHVVQHTIMGTSTSFGYYLSTM